MIHTRQRRTYLFTLIFYLITHFNGYSQLIELTDVLKTTAKLAITAQLNYEKAVKERIVDQLGEIYDRELELDQKKQVLSSISTHTVLGVTTILFVDTFVTYYDYKKKVNRLKAPGVRFFSKYLLNDSFKTLELIDQEMSNLKKDSSRLLLTALSFSGGVGKNYIATLQLIKRIMPLRMKVLKVKNNIDNLNALKVIFPRS